MIEERRLQHSAEVKAWLATVLWAIGVAFIRASARMDAVEGR